MFRESPLFFLSYQPHPQPRNWLCLTLTPDCSLSQEEKPHAPGVQILLCVLRKSLALSEPESLISNLGGEEADSHPFIPGIFTEHLLGRALDQGQGDCSKHGTRP